MNSTAFRNNFDLLVFIITMTRDCTLCLKLSVVWACKNIWIPSFFYSQFICLISSWNQNIHEDVVLIKYPLDTIQLLVPPCCCIPQLSLGCNSVSAPIPITDDKAHQYQLRLPVHLSRYHLILLLLVHLGRRSVRKCVPCTRNAS